MSKKKTIKDVMSSPLKNEIIDSMNETKDALSIGGKLRGGVPKGILEISENQIKLKSLKEDVLAFKIAKHLEKRSPSNGLGSSTEYSVPTSKILADKLDKLLEMKQEPTQVINKTEHNFNGINNGVVNQLSESSIKEQINAPKKQSKATMAGIIKWILLIIGGIASLATIWVIIKS